MNTELQNKAWSVLPKEFKEEVKKGYKGSLFITNRYAKVEADLLEELFGHYNLTSDAEGEEVLTVSRKRVQEMYAHYDKICNDPNRPKDYIESVYEYADGVTMALDDLFGSKCLPDESESPKLSKVEKVGKDCNVDSLPTNVDSSDDCKAEPKFKIGDKVRYVGDMQPTYKGKAFVIDGEVFFNNHYNEWQTRSIKPFAWDGLSVCNVPLTNLEPYTEPEEVAKMKPIESVISVYLATKEEEEEFRLLLHENGFKWRSGRSLIRLSCWSSALEEDKIHFIHPDKVVTFRGKKTPGTLTFSEFKKQYFGEPSNAESAVSCPKSVETLRIASEAHYLNLSLSEQQEVTWNNTPSKLKERIESKYAEYNSEAFNGFAVGYCAAIRDVFGRDRFGVIK